MKVLLTGCSGLLGGHILQELTNRNIEVKCIYRGSIPFYLGKYTQVEFVKGDISDKKSLETAVEGCSAIIHAAADTSMMPTFSQKRHDINVGGTKNLVELAIKNKISRFIYIGTANIFKSGTIDAPGDESERAVTNNGLPEYNTTKILAQKLIEKAVLNDGLQAIITTPCFMIGEEDYKPSSGKMIQTIINEKLPFSTSGGKNVIYVKDVAFAVCNALHQGKIGETYILGNENISYHDLFGKIAHFANVKAPRFKVPSYTIKFFGFLGSTKESILKKEPLFNLPMARASVQKNYFSAKKAVKELDLPQTPLDIAIKNTVDWFLKQKASKN